ncbi:inner membrane-spanning protein YciB [Pseudooceanicola sp. 502str34]|jgi:intracellular septation protein|uniref:inner membrane-spanning protein YciB n=1 Tax=Maritimibacter alkaliphilus TaxID=404236 RepID=UPI001C95255D|nr:inner membrane-spanning protein YciB [Maritimibacter alkaliphilus]MBY6088850.1 septation protein IspZ [Maritimibacter alkaliphilus]
MAQHPAGKTGPKKINPLVKTGLELGPIILFFAAYIWLKDRTFLIGGREYEGFILVTAGFIPLMLICTGILWKLTGHLSKMQIVTAVLITVFGGLSVWLNDDRFFKMKPTLIYLLFGGALGVGLLRGESWLALVMEEVLPLKPEGWMVLTRRLCAFFLGLAVLNEVIWRTMSTESWVYFKTFGLTAAIFAFFITQNKVFTEYALEEEGGDADKPGGKGSDAS